MGDSLFFSSLVDHGSEGWTDRVVPQTAVFARCLGDCLVLDGRVGGDGWFRVFFRHNTLIFIIAFVPPWG